MIDVIVGSPVAHDFLLSDRETVGFTRSESRLLQCIWCFPRSECTELKECWWVGVMAGERESWAS